MGFWVLGFGFRVRVYKGLGLRVLGLGFWARTRSYRLLEVRASSGFYRASTGNC